MGATAPPFTMEIQLWSPLLARKAPLILTRMHSFSVVLSECGETYKLRRYSRKTRELSQIKPQKFSLAFGALTFHCVFGAPSPSCPPFNFGLDPPLKEEKVYKKRNSLLWPPVNHFSPPSQRYDMHLNKGSIN